MQETNARRANDHPRNRLISGNLVPGPGIRYGPVGRESGSRATLMREAIGQLAHLRGSPSYPDSSGRKRRPDAARDAMAGHFRNSLEVKLAGDAGPRDR